MCVGGEEVARDAIVVGSNVRGRVQSRLNISEDCSPFGMQLFKPLVEFASRLSQAVAKHFIGPGGQGGFGH